MLSEKSLRSSRMRDQNRIEFFRHNLGQAELDAIGRVLSGIILTSGTETLAFESKFAAYLGVAQAVAVSSCTSALFLSLLAHDIGPRDEVIAPAMTYVATLNAIAATGARPVLVDVEAETGLMDVSLIEKTITERTRAIIPVHLYGQMCDMKQVSAIAARHNLTLIEDSAHCLEGLRNGQRPGQTSDCACFSFYTTKAITSGEGGMIVTNQTAVAERIRRLRNQGTTRSAQEQHAGGYRHWDQIEFGMKMTVSDIQSAMLIPQLERIDDTWRKRADASANYDLLLGDLCDVGKPARVESVTHAHHLYTIWVEPEKRDAILAYLDEHGIGVAVNYRAVHLLEFQRKALGYEPGDFPNAERIGDSTLSLPLYASLSSDDQIRVVNTLQEALKAC
jgi:UDP-4-amino-4-deoxy-L-arabinose-oxoglutarate aminotransferase